MMPTFKLQERYPGEWSVIIDLPPLHGDRAEIFSVIVGFSNDLFSVAIPLLDGDPHNPYWIEAKVLAAESRFASDSDSVIRSGDGVELLTTLRDFIECSIWHWVMSMYYMQRGDAGDIGSAVSNFRYSAAMLASLDTAFEFLGETEGGAPSPVSNFSVDGGRARQEKNNKLRVFAIELAKSTNNAQSVRHLASRILPDVVNEARRIGAQMAEGNSHRKVYEWLRNAKLK